MRPVLAAAIAVVLSSCAAPSSGAAPPSAGASAATSARLATPASSSVPAPPSAGASASSGFAVVADAQLTKIMLVGTTGAIVASAQLVPKPFGANLAMPWVSATKTRVYYLIDGAELDFVASDGTSGAVRRLAVKANQQAGIAVTPDGSRIAVAILTYTLPPPVSGPGVSSPPKYDGMDLYVEDVSDGSHHVEIFASSTAAEFPVGWIGGKLVVALSEWYCCQSILPNPY